MYMKKYLIVLWLVLSMLIPSGLVLALEVNVGAKTEVKIESRASTTGTKMSEDGSTTDDDEDEIEDSEDNESDEHEDRLGPALKALLSDEDDEDREVAEEVKAVIEEHLENEDEHEDEQKAVENRPGWLIFLIGTDYKNLGGIRSELKTTENHISRLEKAKERVVDASAKAEIEAQIEDLKEAQETLDTFITENESKFSLFGWLFRLFN